MLKIYGRKTSSNVQKVLWCCGELALPFERQDIGGGFGGNRLPGYLTLNPNGLVPTIDDDGFVLWESNAIVRYLSARHGMGSLCPIDLADRADADRWMDWQQTTLAPAMSVLFRTFLKTPADAIDGKDVDAAKAKAAATWSILNARLAERSFVAGASLTMGDIALGNAVHRWFAMPFERPDGPRLEAWYARLCERPAYREHVASV